MDLFASNLAISASAGAGKTFQLAHRFIGLLVRGVPPERLVALTFSRKAAGEIFDAVVGYLVAAAMDAGERRAMAQRLGVGSLAAEELQRVLAILLEALPRLHLGTLDSFAVRLLAAFPLEFGTGGPVALLDDNRGALDDLRLTVLRDVFAAGDATEQRRFLDSYRLATFGQEHRGFVGSLLGFVGDYHQLVLDIPDGGQWGAPAVVWGESPPEWLAWAGEDLVAATAAGAGVLEETPLPHERVRQRLAAFFAAAPNHHPAVELPREVAYLAERLPAGALALTTRVVLKVERWETELSGPLWAAVRRVLGILLAREWQAGYQRLQALYRIMARFEAAYHRRVRGRGLFTFDDVHRTLAQGLADPAIADQVGYRLDCQLDHWLLDEFQDTSTLQWRVLHPLVDECIQDPEKTFFYVGDVKQAIYGWRKGNAALFGEILRHYGGGFVEAGLDASYRSTEAVIDMVNAVFSRVAGVVEVGKAAGRDWEKRFRPHRAAGKTPEPGCAMLLEPVRADGGKPNADDRRALTAALLAEIRPVERGLSCAVLVRSNEQGRRMVGFLRAHCPGLPVALEGVGNLGESLVPVVLLDLLRYAAHPGDTWSGLVVAASPLAPAVQAAGGLAALPALVAGQLAASGFHGVLQHWAAHLPLDEYGGERLALLLAEAEAYDREGDGSVDGFLARAEELAPREEGSGGQVRVMTVHQSKGLGFDVVILPELQNKAVHDRGNDRLWPLAHGCCQVPHRHLARLDPTLAALAEERAAEAVEDSLCLLYVAMTRAKRGLYLVTSFAGKTSRKLDHAALVKRALGVETTSASPTKVAGQEAVVLAGFGDPRWFADLPPTAPPAPSAPPALWRPRPGTPAAEPIRPSSAAEGGEIAAELFRRDRGDSLQLGTVVHHLFEHLAWSDRDDVEAVIARWLATAPFAESWRREAAAHARRALAADPFRRALAHPGGPADLWRERAFECHLAEGPVRGVFDRVVLLGEPGRWQEAVIQDYKTNQVTGDEELQQAADHYRPQLFLYRRALASLLGLDPSRIALELLFTAAGRVVRL